MTKGQFYDWQTAGGGGDVMLLVQTLEHPHLKTALPADVVEKLEQG